eukprot:441971-Pyramimonas_sp.AAC.1
MPPTDGLLRTFRLGFDAIKEIGVTPPSNDVLLSIRARGGDPPNTPLRSSAREQRPFYTRGVDPLNPRRFAVRFVGLDTDTDWFQPLEYALWSP